MKHTNILLAVILATILLVFACEPIDNPDNTDPRDKFTGIWTVNEVSQLYGNNTYTVTIINDPGNSSQVLLKNFYHFGLETETYAIPTTSTITVPQQVVCNYSVSGSGTLNNGKISWSYTVSDGADTDHATATFVKQ
jgi:hypothetical protein